MTEGVILVPGIMGSVLMDGDEVIWPGRVLDLLLPFKHMDELLKQDLQAADVIRSVSISSQYDNLIASLEACGFSESGYPATLKAFPYDWRKDNELAAQQLAECIDAMAAELGNNSEINLVAHSMGGLVSRCYLESGDYSERPGFACVRRLITLGTPHRGAPMALMAAMGQEKRLFLNAEQVKRVASDPRFPSLYQLLPPKSEPFAWNRADAARLEPVDIYSPNNAARLGLEPANLASAVQFHLKLNLDRRPAHVRYFFFAGTQQETAHAVEVTFPQSGIARAVKLDRCDAGDGTVPIWSGAQSGVQMAPVGGEHGDIYKSGALKRMLGALLGKPGVLLATGMTPEISVLHKVVEPGTSTRVTINFPQNTNEVRGELQLWRKVNAVGELLENAPISAVWPINYSGAPIDHLAVLIEAPQYLGIYELGFVPEGGMASAAAAELFVQEV
ncbi:lecithin:cholesterol acyltransferase [Pseudogulbenkiania sp. NH8B]|uniref:lecithin--cholesterol acyltransferase n=1 Tax=Pseudogulbenkiania sp. (strain NH8B) TaxID=748280 RepID=UPI0002279F92|nr:lecithin--cholesterol acyltransferase [Pseudogulbenkiania sp. NH8B]BAK77238.1 lecithin:cholesterol acyltransferase [Pseudogulbenkiania sp. NH8B]